eukprot:gene15330-16907_t
MANVNSGFYDSVAISIFIVRILQVSPNAARLKRKRKGKCPLEIVHLTNKTGVLQTPLYPKRYKNRQTCIWHIEVKAGYQVKLSIRQSKFGISEHSNNQYCLKHDSLVISSRRQRFENYNSFLDVDGPHSLVLCGRNAPNGKISSPENHLWIRFKADAIRHKNQIGFKARYSSVDINECTSRFGYGGCQHNCINTAGSYECTCHNGYILSSDAKTCQDMDECAKGRLYHGCSHHCENTKGAFRCICPYGMRLDASGKRCFGDVTYQVEFQGGVINHNNQKVFHVTLAHDAPLHSEVIKLKAKAIGSNGKPATKLVKYYIIEQNNKTANINDVFQIEEETGLILTKKYLFEQNFRRYDLVVEGKLDDYTGSKVKVKIRVNGSSSDFAGQFFTVLVFDGLKLGHVIFNLQERYRRNGNAIFRFQLRSQSEYFAVKELSGEVHIKKKLPRPKSRKRLWKENLVVLVHRAENEKIFAWKSTISVIMLPTYPGENLLTPDILNEVSKEISKDIRGFSDRVRFSSKGPRGTTSSRLHRLFRAPSEEVRKLSKAKLFFDTVLEKMQLKVKETFGTPGRSGEPIILNLGTGQILSPQKLSEIVDASKCQDAIAKPNCIDQQFHAKYRTYDGTCNNFDHPSWGAAPLAFRRLIPPNYYDIDGLSDPIGFPNVPEAPRIPTPHHLVDEFILLDKKAKGQSGVFSHMLMQWGQFIDHDITFTAESEGGHRCVLAKCDGSAEDFRQPCFPIMYPSHVGECTLFIRSASACQTNKNIVEPRQQLNMITSYMDGSMIYGSSKKQADKLRFLNDSGLMKLSESGFLPFEPNQDHAPQTFCLDFGGCFAAGDGRVNEQILLASMHTMWVREHNRIAKLLRRYNSLWDGEKIYQETRKIIGAKLQHITYTEYLPKILGTDAMPKYAGYKPGVDATIANVFATAAYRFGHSLVRPSLSQLNANFDVVAPELSLVKAFFNNRLLTKHGIERFLFGAIGNFSENTDRRVAIGLAKKLFQRPGSSHGLNLVAINIQRGRDHGLPGYAAWRQHCNLSHAYTFDDVANEIRDTKAREILKKLYDNRIEHADIFLAGMAESLVHGAMVGPTFHCLIRQQFLNLRDGDRFYYENKGVFTSAQLKEIKKTSLAKVMCNNLKGMVSVQRDVFHAFHIPDFRIACERLKDTNIAVWRENSFVSDRTDIGHWSAWVNTVRLSTGTWASIIGRNICGNETISDIQCQTINGMPYTNAGENTVCDQRFGVYCRDSEQAKVETKCSHYRFRMRCANFPRQAPSKPERPTGEPREKIAAAMNCTRRSKMYLKQGMLGVIVFNPPNIAMAFPVLDSVVLDNPFEVTPKREFLLLGKGERGYKKRALMTFDLRRIKRYDIIHSAKLQIYYAGEKQSRSSLNVLARTGRQSITVEAYLVKSSRWKSDNVTSRMPWHGDHLDLAKDVNSKLLSSVTISPSLPTWIELDLYRAIVRWRISVKHRLANYGVLLRITGDGSSVGVFKFGSSHHANEAIRPRLLICMASVMW